MAIILGLASALTYGAADFLGGLATRRTKVLSVVLLSQLFGAVLLVALLPFFRGATLSPGGLSMYPATTVLLARLTLGERFEPSQSVGLLLAVAGVVAIALG